jgi:hypothetical protein
MLSFANFILEKKLYIDVWHGSKTPFNPPFDESKIATTNDEGYSGRGFYFFGNEEDVQYAVPKGYKRKFRLLLDNAFNLDKNDIFSADRDESIPFWKYRDEETLKLLKLRYDGAYRTLNGKLDEICVFSYKKRGYDGNRKIQTIDGQDWIKM